MIARRGVWAYADRLPVKAEENIVSLGEGGTPLLDLGPEAAARFGVARILAKAEDRNPTGSFKARIATVAYSLVRERGLHGTVGTSSGNGGAAAAAYAAAAGSRAVLFTLADIVAPKLREITAVGASVTTVRSVGHDAASTRAVAEAVAAAAAARGFYPMLTGFRYAPEAMEGVKTLAFELADDAPELSAVYLPVGGGGLMTGVHRGYAEYDVPMPRLVGVQPDGAAALRRALGGHPEGIDGQVTTTVSGLQMATLYDVDGAVHAVRDSAGHAVEVSDRAVWAAQELLARRHGLLVEPAGATALAGVAADAAAGRLRPDDQVAVVLSGAGHKDVAALDRLAGEVRPALVDPGDVDAVLDDLLEA